MSPLRIKYRKFLQMLKGSNRLLVALNKDPTYEAFSAQCPICEEWSTFNRISDLQTLCLINPRQVVCESPKCGSDFIIKGDFINPAWQMLILDCETLKTQKRYMYCILNLAQAFEMYFGLYFRVEFLYKPYAHEGLYDIENLNRRIILLFETTKKYTYSHLRNMFINSVLQSHTCSTLAESEVEINKLPSMKNDPSDSDISAYSDPTWSSLLLKLKQCNIGTLRNNVVHKYGYRPKIEEVEKAIEETTSILSPIDHRLGLLADDVNFYCATK